MLQMTNAWFIVLESKPDSSVHSWDGTKEIAKSFALHWVWVMRKMEQTSSIFVYNVITQTVDEVSHCVLVLANSEKTTLWQIPSRCLEARP